MSRIVEWVETTGKTVEEAKEAALDRLGVDEQDAEFEVIEEPRSGLFGRTRGVGRVRARVVPRSPRPKPERRRRSKKDGAGEVDGGDRQKSGGRKQQDDKKQGGQGTSKRSTGGSKKGSGTKKQPASPDSEGARSAQTSASDRGDRAPRKEREAMDTTAQCEVITEFLEGLASAMGLEVTVRSEMDGEVLRGTVDGSEVGLLIGPRLGTLDAIQEIARNVLQRHADGREYAKVVIDVAGVREMRRTALAAFVRDAAQRVVDDGDTVTFEVMSSIDRKVVHDTVAEIDGVVSTSEGEDPRRRVVLRPA